MLMRLLQCCAVLRMFRELPAENKSSIGEYPSSTVGAVAVTLPLESLGVLCGYSVGTLGVLCGDHAAELDDPRFSKWLPTVKLLTFIIVHLHACACLWHFSATRMSE